jgi:threonine dehydrogenase-like Zn-dependent dehydrogenase
MRAAVFEGPGSISVADRPDPTIAGPTDAVVRVVLSCVCGSDLWYFRGDSPFEPARSATSSWGSSRKSGRRS